MARARIGDERRELILNAFESCVLRDGLAKTTLQKVADESGLPRSLVRYFIGNRADMVALLIDRMIERGESSLTSISGHSQGASIGAMVDMMFDRIFADPRTNGIVGQLWVLAVTDLHVRARLVAMYRRVEVALVEQLRAEGVGPDDEARSATAFSILSLAYGSASFRSLFEDEALGSLPRQQAHALIEALRQQGNAA